MSSGRNITINSTTLYIIAIVVIIVAFLILGGGPWMSGMMHEGRPLRVANWNWVQILISLIIGFIVGVVVARRKW
jgi:uncharacterized protein YneF (UPF0154 family)